MARRYDSEAVRNRVLSTSVRLFLERGYHGTTMAAILKEADVSSSSFQNVFGNKDGVMYELMKLMFAEQFSAADSAVALLGSNASPAFAYALETSVQLTIAELSEIIRDLYLQAYASERSLEYIRRNTAKHLQKYHRGHKTARFAFHCKGCRETAFRCAVRHFRSSASSTNIRRGRVRQGRVCRIAGRKAQVCCPPAGRQCRHAAACRYRIPITPPPVGWQNQMGHPYRLMA